jgi:hypothetical protein
VSIRQIDMSFVHVVVVLTGIAVGFANAIGTAQ